MLIKTICRCLEDNFEAVFEMCILVVIFAIGCIFIAMFPNNEELARWITGGIVVGVIARAAQSNRNSSRSPAEKEEPPKV